MLDVSRKPRRGRPPKKTLFDERQLDAHYREVELEPIQIIEINELPYHEACIVKYVLRWQHKNGLDDLLKAKWYIDRLIALDRGEIEFGEKPT